jgi:pyruvate kinase
MPAMTARRAKIVATLGPASRGLDRVRALVEAGMDVARLNFSHGTPEEHRAACAAVRAAAATTGRAVAVLADLQGPKIRLGTFAGGSAVLEAGREFVLTTDPVAGDAARAGTTYAALPRDVKPGDVVLLDDGNLRLEVLASDGRREVRCRVIEGGAISDHKGINLPGVAISEPALTAKDREDLRLALELGADWVALSFVRGPEDAAVIRQAMIEAGGRLPVIAKLEKPEAVARLAAVIDAFDGLMVARGDLGVEMPLEQVPLVQRRAVRLARERGKPVIVATQMLESMILRSRPTRAEVSDVANAVIEGADAVMLSGETSVGAHPVEAVATMARIVATSEGESAAGPERLVPGSGSIEDAISAAAARVAGEIGACALVPFTISGATAARVARHRPAIAVLAFTPDEVVRRRLALVWGVETFVMPPIADTDTLVARVDRALLERGRGRPGDAVVIVAGTPPGVVGNTNTVRVHRLGGSD